MTEIKIKILDPKNFDIELPAYMTKGSAGMDIRAFVKDGVTIKPMERKLIPTGFAMALPDGFEAQIRPRSGLAVKKGITVINSPGTIDSDYRGEVKIGLVNLSSEEYVIEKGERIAQMIISKVEHVKLIQADNLEDTSRSTGGFGHTGAI
ncbi:MAG: dUTP diphosphatase [Desulfobacteraceae bacterium]|nr:dUTP diphosphatase [Desulfobacteraceae bacterium]MCB9494811.1 dUTP diphosphatase [Desulfobacteraceae bacterium]